MFKKIFFYFGKKIFHKKKKQGVLILALFGLALSAFSLLLLQSVMNGLQKTLVERSYKVEGSFTIHSDDNFTQEVFTFLDKYNLNYWKELQVEVLFMNEDKAFPGILHGVSYQGYLPEFLKELGLGPETELIMGQSLAHKVYAYRQEKVGVVAPHVFDPFFGDVPRQVFLSLDDTILTDVQKVDSFHAYTRLSVVQNLIKQKTINQIRVFGDVPKRDEFLFSFRALFGETYNVTTWEQENSSLDKALQLENFIMILLFMAMTGLISLTIMSGYNLFFSKVKREYLTFWILGLSRKELTKMFAKTIFSYSFLSTSLGIALGLLVIFLIKQQSWNILPDVFVDRSLPARLNGRIVLIAFITPLTISLVFSFFSFRQFLSDNSDLLVRLRNL